MFEDNTTLRGKVRATTNIDHLHIYHCVSLMKNIKKTKQQSGVDGDNDGPLTLLDLFKVMLNFMHVL